MTDKAPDDNAPLCAGMTYRSALVCATHVLERRGIEGANADARRLLSWVTGATSLDLAVRPDQILDEIARERLVGALARRGAGEPVSRITGIRGFYGRDFQISAATLDPRPESETLIDAALEFARRDWPHGDGLEILDIGTGSGCLLVTLLAELPGARGVGVDPSSNALDVARTNAERLGVATRATFVVGRSFAGLGRRFPLIVSNPPYIPTADIAGLDVDVRNYDPALALDGGVDGLEIYREIAAGLGEHAAPGLIAFEIGETQASDVEDLVRGSLAAERSIAVRRLTDLAGKPRCVAISVHNG